MNKRFTKAASLFALLLILSACAQSSSAPAPGQADLTAITVAGADLTTPLAAGVTACEAYVPAGTATVSIVARAADPRATVSFGGLDAGSIPVGAGQTVIPITVTSADGAVRKGYTLTIVSCAATVSMTVLDSVNGSLLAAAGIVYRVFKSGLLVGSLTATGNPQTIHLPSGVSYRIEASAPERAASAIESVVAGAGGAPYTFICQKLGMSTFPAVSPEISAIQKTAAADPSTASESDWVDMVDGDALDLAAVTGFRVRVDGYSVIEPTSWSGAGVMIDFDNLPVRLFNGLTATATSNTYDGKSGIFHALAIFGYAGRQLLPGPHSLNVVVYDRVNNRVEKRLPVDVVSAVVAGADISGSLFSDFTADMRIYGVSREYLGVRTPLALDPLPTGGSSYYVRLTFKFKDLAAANQPILGFFVKRSEDGGVTFADAGCVNYGALSTGSAGTHTFYDASPGLEIGIPYTYKVEAFTDAVQKKESATITGTFLPAFTASLAAPVKGAKDVLFDNDAGTGPDYRFSISDPSLWDATLSDTFYFAPLIREKTGTIAFYGEFRYKLATNALEFKSGSDWVDVVATYGGALADYIAYANGMVTCKARLFSRSATNWWGGTPLTYMAGVTYEWDIFGAYTSGAGEPGSSTNMVSSYFAKSAGGTVSRSYADARATGQQTLNGWFDFTAKQGTAR